MSWSTSAITQTPIRLNWCLRSSGDTRPSFTAAFTCSALRCGRRAGLSPHETIGIRWPPSGSSNPPSVIPLIQAWLEGTHLHAIRGQACIANTGHVGITPMYFATSKTYIASGMMSLDELRWKWAASELQRPDEYGITNVIATIHSDIHGIGMAIYEASPRNLFVLL